MLPKRLRSLPRVALLQSRPARRSCRRHPIRLMVAPGLVHQAYGPTYREAGPGGSYRTTPQMILGIVRRFSGGVKAMTGERKTRRISPLLESGWTGQHLSCPLTRTRTPDGPVTATMLLLLTGFLFPPLAAGRLPDATKAKN